MKQLGQLLGRQWILLTIVGLVIVASTIRLRMYGDLRLSMANNDTATYVDSSNVNLLSWDAFTARRLFTTNMIYQVMKPDGDYHVLVNGSQNTRNRPVQPYFNTANLPWRRTLAPLGDLLHPESPIPVFLDLLVLFGICGLAVIRRIPRAAPWAWLATWLFLAAFINISVVILGDSFGLTRHALLATTAFRFFMWFFLIVLIDLALLRPDEDSDTARPAPEASAAPVALT